MRMDVFIRGCASAHSVVRIEDQKTVHGLNIGQVDANITSGVASRDELAGHKPSRLDNLRHEPANRAAGGLAGRIIVRPLQRHGGARLAVVLQDDEGTEDVGSHLARIEWSRSGSWTCWGALRAQRERRTR